MLLSKISIPGLFLSKITEKLFLDKSSFEEQKLLKEINTKNECTILNPSIDKSKLNENLTHSSIKISNILISKLHLYFNNNNLDSSIKIDNITVDLIKNNNITQNKNNNNEKEKDNISNFSMLSGYLHNLSISVQNIKIRFIEEKTNNILYCLFINEINYQNNKDENKNNEKEKLNYLFCNNKTIYIGRLVIKEGYTEDDEIFFKNDEEYNKVNFYTNPKILMVIYNKIQITINHDYQNKKLIINNINSDNLFIECIMNITQIKNLIKFNQLYLNNIFKEKLQRENKEDINNNLIKENDFDLFGFKIKKLEINVIFNYCYFIFLNNEQNINKFWIFYKNYFDKYYTMNIEQKKSSEKINQNNLLSLMQKHFCYFEKEYYLIYFNQMKFSIKNDNKNNFVIESPSFISRLIQPNKISEKINVIIIDNKSNNNTYIDNEQSFNNLFLPYYKKVIQFGYYTHNIFSISNFEIRNNEIDFNEIDFEINSFTLFNIFNCYKIIYGEIKEKESEVNNEKDYEYNYIIKGKRANFDLLINKKWIDYIKDKKPNNNCFDSHFYSEKVIISLENIQFNINSNYQKILYNLHYNKIYGLYIMKNIVYPLIYIINNKHNDTNSDKQILNNIIVSKLNNNNINVESNYKYIINFDKINTFVNPILISFYIIQYLKLFLYTFDIFKENKNKSKNKKYLYDIEENLNIDFMSSQNEIERNFFLKILLKLLKNIEINIEELNFIFFCHLSLNNAKFDIKSLYYKNENIFKLILSPIIILKLKEFSFKYNKIKMNNLLLIFKTKIENFIKEDIIYKEIIGNIDINSENCEFIIYKSKTNINILEGEIKIDEKKRNIKLELNIEDIVFCPISNNYNEIVMNIEKNLSKYIKMNSYLFGCFPFMSEKMDLINYEKKLKNNHIYNIDPNNDIKYKIKLKCNKLFLDLYSTNKNKIFYDRNIFENIIEKNKMRLIIEFGEITMEYTHNQKINLSVQKVNSAFLKDLRISHTSCCLLIDDFSIINYSIVNNSNENSTNSLYYLKMSEENKININTQKININKETKLGSIIANSGFVPIIECEKGITVNINLFKNNNNYNIIGINTNNEIIFNDINLKFCKDSLKDIIYFFKKLPYDIKILLNLKSSFEDDFEKIIIEKDTLSINNLKGQFKNRDIDNGSSIDFHSVKTEQKGHKNNDMYHRLFKSINDNNIDNESINSNNKINKKEKNIKNHNNNIYQEKNKNKNKKKNYKINLSLNDINIYLYEGEDFNFQGSHTLVVFSHSAFTAENRSNQDNVIKTNDRNINNNILISLKKLNYKYSQKYNEIDINLSLKSLIIEDNIEISLYKKLLSHFDFQNDKNIFFNSKIKIIKEINENGDNIINASLDITPIAIYLDKITLDFLINYYNVLKYIIKNEDEEENEEDEICSNNSNKKLNNRIIKNNEDIMNINNSEDNNSNINNELQGEEISTIHQFQNDNLKSVLNPDKLFVKSLIINPFFISFNYNPRKENDSEEEEIETNIKNKDSKLSYIQFIDYLKNISLNEFILNFKKYDNHKENKRINIKNIFKELFDYYYNDIIDYQSFNNYVKALPVVNKFCSIFDGFLNIWDKTVNHEKNNKTLQEGLVQGTQELVVNTACSILSLGETITTFLGKKLNINESANNKNEIIKNVKKKINENLFEKEEYYYK